MAAFIGPIGQLIGGQNQAAAYDQNARNELQQSHIAIGQSYVKAGQIADETARVAGRQAAAYGASGVVVGSGTPLQVMADTATRGEMARQLALYQGRVNALSYEQQSDIDRAQASAAKTASYFGAASTLLTNLNQAATQAAAFMG